MSPLDSVVRARPIAKRVERMDYLLCTLGSHGDVHPFVGIGIELKARGHSVSVMANPHFESLIAAAGLDFIPVGTDAQYRELAGDPKLWHKRTAVKAVLTGLTAYLREMYDKILARAAGGQTVVVGSSLCLAARVAQDAYGIPTVIAHLAPSLFRSIIKPAKYPGVWMPAWLPDFVKRKIFEVGDKWVVDPAILPELNKLRGEVGLQPVSRVMDQWWHSPELTLGLFPEWFGQPQADWPAQVKLTGFPRWDEKPLHAPDGEWWDFVHEGDAPIVFTPGSAMWDGAKFFKAAVKACEKVGRRGILLTRHRDHLPANLPESVRHFDYIPLSDLLPHTAVLVHHGGIGTSAQALAAGTRQIVMPFAHDQLDNAQRLTQLGIARTVSPYGLTARKLAKALSAIFNDKQYYIRAHWVSEYFRGEQPLAGAVEALEKFAAEKIAAPVKMAVG